MHIVLPVIIVAAIGLILGLGLSLAAKFMAVPTDEKQEKIREALPGANCGACGYSGCDGYAQAIADGEALPDKCSPGGAATAKALSEILGVDVVAQEKCAYIACSASPQNTTTKYAYSGMLSCAAANLVHGGPLDCAYGCIGFCDCYNVCEYNAIKLANGRPIICEDLCTACGKCVSACPKSLISIIPKSAKTRVSCSNKQRGASVAKQCKMSCIACMQCEKKCPYNAIKIIENLAVIDYELCTDCGKCKEVCKRNAII